MCRGVAADLDSVTDAALVADHSAVLHALVLSAQALPVGYRAEDTEQTVTLWFERTVVDGFRFGHPSMRPATDLLREARLMRMASKSAMGLAISKGLERNKVILHSCGCIVSVLRSLETGRWQSASGKLFEIRRPEHHRRFSVSKLG
jgi:hypothetical protein